MQRNYYMVAWNGNTINALEKLVYAYIGMGNTVLSSAFELAKLDELLSYNSVISSPSSPTHLNGIAKNG